MSATLLPDPDCLRLECLSACGDAVLLMLTAKSDEARCPRCETASGRVHSRYQRTLADLPWNGVPVKLHLTIRRFFCDREDCSQRIFAERLPTVAPTRARRTDRLTRTMEVIGFELGGEAGARVLQQLAVGSSPDTVLRLIRRAALPTPDAPRVLGVDDFAFRSGHSYGTLLVDLERHRRVDLLPDRQAETLAAWLIAHPGVEVIGRDRGGAYAEAGRQGAPTAVQVADRWHVLANVRDALEDVLVRQHRALRQTAATLTAQRNEAARGGCEEMLPEPEPQQLERTRDLRRAVARREQRLARYEEVQRLRAAGLSLRQIADRLGLARGTVHRFVRASEFPERAMRPPYPSIMDPYEGYLRSRWSEGCQNATQLWREIQALGFPGGRSNVRDRLKQWRQTPSPHGAAAQRHTEHPLPPPVVPRSPRQMSWLFVLAPERLSDDDRAELTQFMELMERGSELYVLAQEFGRLVRAPDVKALESWMATAEAMGFPELVTFVRGIRRDQAAVNMMLSSRWSNGQTEGQVNRLKMIKRQMFGRAKFDLLRQRVLYVG